MNEAPVARAGDGAPDPLPERYVFPASFAQRRLYFLDPARGNGAAYNISRAFVLDGAFDVEAFRGALHDLVQRHESLRTTFRIEGGEPVQVVSPPGDVPLCVVDLLVHPTDERMGEVQRRVAADASTRFDLAHGPLLRVSVMAIGSGRHVIGLTVHHIIVDGWSLGVLRRDLAALYTARVAGLTVDLPDLPIQYADFAVWERERQASGCWEPHRDYWRQQLRGLSPRLELPVDFARRPESASLGGRVIIDLPPGVHQKVRRLARATDATPFMVVLAAFAAFLHRCTGAADIGIGTPVAGRDRVELEHVAGLFVNTVVMRTRIDGEATFEELLRAVRETALNAFRHQEVPFDDVVRAVEAPRVPGTPPLFQVMFAYDTTDEVRDAFTDHGGVTLETDTGTAKYDLTLGARDIGAGLRLGLEYNAHLFLRATADRLLRVFSLFLQGAVGDPALSVTAIPWMDAAGAADAVAAGVGARQAYAPDESIHARVERQALRRPDAIAVEDGTLRVTYVDLNRRADAIAETLRRHGVGRGSLVAVCLPRGAGMIASLLGVLKSGGAYVPLDPSQPAERLRLMLDNASPAAIVASRAVATGLPATTATRIYIEEVETAPADRSGGEAVSGEDPAYVMYTSGSTGTPKGVVIPHRAISRLVVNSNYISIQEQDRIAQASNASFDAATFEIWGALLNGATLVHVGADDVSSPGRPAKQLAANQISILFVTTAVFNAVARHDAAAFAPLRVLLFGGEAVDVESVRRVLSSGAPRTLLHVYGPTESTTFATAHAVTALSPGARTVPIGRPIANTDAHVLDPAGRPVPDGIVGELYLGGDGLALGYHGQPELTAARFVPHPFDAGRLYRTGDLCRRVAGGELEYVGRTDRQVKIRGFRIEPAEIEAALVAAPGVERAVVETVEEDGGGRRLVAYVQPVTGVVISAASLRAELRRSLPQYMVPSAFVLAAELPISANGKIDRERLASAGPAPEEPRGIVSPRDPLEAELVQIWEEVLGVAPIGITDDFFDVGGHSLLAAEMIERVRERFDRTVPLSFLLRGSTIEAFATALCAAGAMSGDLVAVRPAGIRPPLFFFHGDFNGGGLYCCPLARLLDPEQPFYAVAPIGHDGSLLAYSIERMAVAHLDAIRRERPRGPYVLGGYCNGALVAFETARLLRSTGEKVLGVILVHPAPVEARLALLDRLVRGIARMCRMDDEGRVNMFVRTCRALRAIGRQSGRARVKVIARKVRHALFPGSGLPLRRVAAPAGDDETASARVWRHDPAIWTVYHRAVAAYVPRPQDIPVHLLMAPNRTGERADRSRGWRRVAPHGILQSIAGNHRTCITQEIGSLASAMDSALRTLQATHDV